MTGQRKLIVVTGKGGVGKTTVSAALGMLAARQGRRAIIVEVGDQRRLGRLFGVPDQAQGEEVELSTGLWSTTIDPDIALVEWLGKLGGRISARTLGSSTTFQYFAAAAPGAKELISMVKVWELTQHRRWGRRARDYDLVLLDAPATGHALAMLASPQTFMAVARVGPIAAQAQAVGELLRGPECGYLAVAHASEMAVTETFELQEGLRSKLGRELDAVIVNAVMPRRFSESELAEIEATASAEPIGNGSLHEDQQVLRAALGAARSAHRRGQAQHAQLARLRRRRLADGSPLKVLSIPFAFQAELDLAAVQRISERLQRRLEQPVR